MSKKITISVIPQIVPLDEYDKESIFEFVDSASIETLIMCLRDMKEVQILLLRFAGYNYKEIRKAMNMKSIGDYYVAWRKLREDVDRVKRVYDI